MKTGKGYSLLYYLLLLIAPTVSAQHQEVTERAKLWKGKEVELKDTTSILYAFRSGKVEGHLRYYFSATDNSRGLTDYHANAFGGGLRYETGKFHGFQLAISGFYVFNIGSSNLTVSDKVTKQPNRYEIGLFDIQNPGNKKDIDRLEEFYIKYSYRQSYIRFGRQLINTPFINLQDGRMRPTGVEGFWIEVNEIKKVHLEGGWIYAVSPRSTVKWFGTEKSVGLYPMGVTTDGKKSDYLNNINSKGVFMLGAKYKPTQWMDITLWDMLFENVQNSLLIQADFNIKYKKNTTFLLGMQLIRQDAIKDGGNADQTKTYINRRASALTAGTRLGFKYKQLEVTANYNRIFNNGRYLMPREWGREPFYTFMPRERNEGMGDVHAVMAKVSYSLPVQRIKASVAAGYVKLPDVKNYTLNKYGLPSYTQINVEIKYSFAGIFKGLEAQLLVVAKLNEGELYNDKRYEFNKVNMALYNLVLNYYF